MVIPGNNPLAYEGIAQPNPPNAIVSNRSPTTTDLNFAVDTIWVNQVSNTVWVLTSISLGAATWTAMGAGAGGSVVTITGDSGGAESPLAGNFNIKGTANQIQVAGTANTETISLIGPYTPATYTAHGVLIGEGTSSVVATTPGTTGQVLIGSTGADPAFGALGVNSALTVHGVVIAENNSAFVATTAGTTGQVLIGATAADPVFGALGVNSALTAHGVLIGENNSAIVATTAGTNGQVLLGSTGVDPAFGTLTTSTGITYTTGAASLALNVASGGFKVNAASSGVSLVAQNSYTVTQAGQASFALPATAAVGDMFLIASALGNTAGWIITQGASQEIWSGTSHTTNGATGTLAGAIHTSVLLMCTITNLEFIVLGNTTGYTFT